MSASVVEADVQSRRGTKVSLDIKIVPDVFCPTDAKASDADGVVLFFYGFAADCVSGRTRRCQSCGPHITGLDQAGVALRQPLTAEQLEYPMQLCMRKVDPLVVRMYPIGGSNNSGYVTGSELADMQRYHRAAMCNESESKGDNSALNWMKLPGASVDKLSSKGGSEAGLPSTVEEWTKSSNGAWYVLFPLPLRGSGPAEHQHQHPPFSLDPDAGRLVLTSWWNRYLRSVAEEAQVLMHNLRVQLRVNQDFINERKGAAAAAPAKEQPAAPHPNPNPNPSSIFLPEEVKTPKELAGLLISRGPGVIYHILPEHESFQYVTDAMALVPAERVRQLQSGQSVPQRQKLCPGQGLSAAEFKSACDALLVSPTTSGNCGRADVQEGCDGRKVVDVRGSLYAAWTYGDHYTSKGVLSAARLAAIQAELGGNPLVDEHMSTPLPGAVSGEGHRLVLALTAPRQLRLTELLSFPDVIDAEIMAEALAAASTADKGGETVGIAEPGTLPTSPTEEHSHANPIYLLPEVCRPLGQGRHFFIGQAVGACLWRLEGLLVAHEARAFVLRMLADSIGAGKTSLMGPAAPAPEGSLGRHICSTVVDDEGRWMEYKFVEEAAGAPDGQTFRVHSPSLAVIMEALTPRMTCDARNSGRLEMLGDSLLKAYAAVEMFLNETKLSEGAMTEGRRVITNNRFMADLCTQIGLSRFLRPMSLSGGSHFLLHRPPGITDAAVQDGRSLWSASFVVDGEGASSTPVSHTEVGGKKKKSKSKSKQQVKSGDASAELASQAEEPDPMEDVPAPHQHSRSYVPSKYLADVVEAVIGAFYDSGGWVVGTAMARVLLGLNEARTRVDDFRDKKIISEEAKATARHSQPLFGGCACGHVRYVARGLPADLLVCHCSMCPASDRTFDHPSLGAGAPWVAVARLEKDPAGLLVTRSSPSTDRAHCEKCKQAIFKRYDFETKTDWVALNSLNERATVQASLQERHVHCGLSAAGVEHAWPGKSPSPDDPCNAATAEPSATACSSCQQMREACICSVITPQTHPPILAKPQSRQVHSEASAALCLALNYQFRSTQLLDMALTHASILGSFSNQRLEFLGDAVVDIGVVSHLFREVPQALEGDLSEARASCVSNVYLSKIAIHRVGVHKWLKCGSVELQRELSAMQESESSIEEYWSPQAILERRLAGREIPVGDIPVKDPVVVAAAAAAAAATPDTVTVTSAPKKMAIEAVVVPVAPKSWADTLSASWLSFTSLVSALKDYAFGSDDAVVAKMETVATPKPAVFATQKCVGAQKACADALEALYGAMYLDSGGSIQVLQQSLRHVGILHERAIEEAHARRRHREQVERRFALIASEPAGKSAPKK